MAWPYHFLDITEEQKLLRRQLLDRSGTYAQLSALVPIAIYHLLRLALWAASERKRAKPEYEAVPSSPTSKKAARTQRGTAVKKWRAFSWWLGGRFVWGWGKRGEWIAGISWWCWLLFLCSHETGQDYLHITKRFGVVAASQFPVQYALSMKNAYSPLSVAFRTSHEQLNPFHRISGRVIYSLLLLHAAFYFNFFIQNGLLVIRLTSLVPILGVVALSMLTILASTSLSWVRNWSYRVFIVTHGTISTLILPILFFHTPVLRIYIVEAVVLLVFDKLIGKLHTVNSAITITAIPDTDLLKLEVPLTATDGPRFKATPGQHIYLTLPPDGPAFNSSLHNPFTIASTTPTSLNLFIRTMSGPMTLTLNQLASLPQPTKGLAVEGPYGSAPSPSALASFDRVLFVAGGVGATFILPMYNATAAASSSPSRLTLIWAARSLADASWAPFPPSAKLYVTEASTPPSPSPSSSNGVELADMLGTKGSKDDTSLQVAAYRRPNLREIVDGVFRQGLEERVAVVVCGPSGMARDLRACVGKWAGKGRAVLWHDEYFGF